MSEIFICPRSIAEGRNYEAEWRKDKTCSYDGSLHPDVFMDYVRAGKKVGTTDKSYKFYLEEYEGRTDGAKKFYTHHLSEEQGYEFWELCQQGKVNFGDFPPYVPMYLPGPSNQKKVPSTEVEEASKKGEGA